MDCKGKTILITGGTSGIGYETLLRLAHDGAKVIFTARDEAKGNEVCRRIQEITGNTEVSMMMCRMDSFRSISSFAEEFSNKHQSLDVLINNAGLWEKVRKESEDGIELTFAVNHLASFLLTNLLMPLIRRSSPARIITVASEGHRNTDIVFDDIEFKKEYPLIRAYNQSKLANILFTRKLSQILSGTGITVNCCHPGVVRTPIFDKLTKLQYFFIGLIMIAAAKGAENSVFLATAEEVKDISGKYFKKCRVNPGSKASRDMEMAERLWKLSEEYTKQFYKPGNYQNETKG